jgi:PHD/YefM family antitoxin component YafN of YafNO toxin-antitoxin module
MSEIQYISDANGNPTGVIFPIDLWNEIESEKETAYLLKSEEMKKRLLEAKDRIEGITLAEASEKLGI